MVNISLPKIFTNESNGNKERRRSGIIPVDGVEHPTDVDVLLGRGKKLLNHPGNIAFRDIVLQNKVCYTTSIKTEKLKISKAIVHAIYLQNGRFLKQDNKTKMWIDISEKKAVEKTSQALREQQSKIRDELQKQGVAVDFSKTFLSRQAPFRATTTITAGANDNTSDPVPEQSPALERASTTDGSCMLQRQAAFRIDPISGVNASASDDTFLAVEPTLARASTLDFGSLEMNSDDLPFLPPSPLSSPAAASDSDVLDVSRKIFEQVTDEAAPPSSFRDDSVFRRSSLIDADDDDAYDIETSSACDDGSSRKLSLLSRMSGLTDDLAMSQKQLQFVLKGISSIVSDAPADRGSFMRNEPKKYDSLASNDSMPTVQSVQSKLSRLSCMSGFSSSSLEVSDNDVDNLVSGLITKMSLDVPLCNIQENENEMSYRGPSIETSSESACDVEFYDVPKPQTYDSLSSHASSLYSIQSVQS